MQRLNSLLSILFLILLVLLSEISFCQSKYNFKTLSNDFEEIVKQPGNWDSNDLLTIAGVAGLTYGSMYLDSIVRDAVLKNQQYRNSITVEFGRIWGEPWLTAALGAGFYLHGLAAENTANKKIGFEIGESALYTGLLTLFLKYSFGRERPRENNDPFSFSPFSFRNDNFLSINSGHTAIAFSLSTVLAKNTSNDYLKAVIYLPAFLTAFSRVYQNHHWTSDVILGGIVGYTIAEFVTGLHKTDKTSEGSEFSKPIPILNYKISF